MAVAMTKYRQLKRVVRAELRGRRAVAILECGHVAPTGDGTFLEQTWNAWYCTDCEEIDIPGREQPEHFGWQ